MGFPEALLVLLWGLSEPLAAEVVTYIGGPNKFFALLDLSTTPGDWKGFMQ